MNKEHFFIEIFIENLVNGKIMYSPYVVYKKPFRFKRYFIFLYDDELMEWDSPRTLKKFTSKQAAIDYTKKAIDKHFDLQVIHREIQTVKY
jgi:hypothetical protein